MRPVGESPAPLAGFGIRWDAISFYTCCKANGTCWRAALGTWLDAVPAGNKLLQGCELPADPVLLPVPCLYPIIVPPSALSLLTQGKPPVKTTNPKPNKPNQKTSKQADSVRAEPGTAGPTKPHRPLPMTHSSNPNPRPPKSSALHVPKGLPFSKLQPHLCY